MFNPNKAPVSNNIENTNVKTEVKSELALENAKTEQILKEIDPTKLAEKLKDPTFVIKFAADINKAIDFLRPFAKYIPALVAGIATLTSFVFAITHPSDPNREGFTPDAIAGMITGVLGLLTVGSATYAHDVVGNENFGKDNRSEAIPA